MELEAGEDFAFKISDYFKYSDGSKIAKDDYTMDATTVNTDKVGNYNVKVTFGKGKKAQEYTVKVSVSDTVAPEITGKGDTANGGYVWLKDLNEDMSQYVETTDVTKVDYSYDYEKLGDLSEATDDVIAGYLEQIKTKSAENAQNEDAKEEVKESMEASETTENAEETASVDNSSSDNKSTGNAENNGSSNNGSYYTAYFHSSDEAYAFADSYVKSILGNDYTGRWRSYGSDNQASILVAINTNAGYYYEVDPGVAWSFSPNEYPDIYY